MTSDPFSSAAPDFSDPLGLLRACHQRIEQHCATLEQLANHLPEHGVDAEARKAAGQVHRYFSTAGRHHHDDEEKDLFPLLARQSLKLADRVHALRQDHVEMEVSWQTLAPYLEKLGTVTDHNAFTAAVTDFVQAYRSHIRREEEELLTVAQHLLSGEQLKKLGRAMAERRGQRPGYL